MKETPGDNQFTSRPATPPAADPPPIELEIEAAKSAGASERKFLTMAVVVAACIAMVHFFDLKDYATNVQAWKQRLDSLGAFGSIIFGLACTALIAMGVPRLVFCMAAGMLFGFWEGFVIGQLSALMGSYATFAFARWGGREWVARRIENRRRLRELLRRPSTFTVFLARQLPIAGIIPNLILGVTPVRHRAFLLGSFLGYLPSSAMVALIGSGLGKQSLGQALWQVTMAMLGLGAFSAIVWHVRRKLPPAGHRKPEA
jgi:uncharacterized membrane protein YdjX (TVP38/TMEM64 family)